MSLVPFTGFVLCPWVRLLSAVGLSILICKKKPIIGNNREALRRIHGN